MDSRSTIVGDKATLRVTNARTSQWETVHFVKEDGAWKVSLEGDGRDSRSRA